MKMLFKVLPPLALLLTLVTGLCFAPLRAQARILVATNSTWRLLKGTSEASTPTNFWREVDFDDSAWLTAAAPFHFGTNAVGGDDGQLGGTILSDMQGNYTCIFLRQTFVIDDTNSLQGLWLNAWYDDGFAIWINAQPPRNPAGVSGNSLACTGVSASAHRGPQAGNGRPPAAKRPVKRHQPARPRRKRK